MVSPAPKPAQKLIHGPGATWGAARTVWGAPAPPLCHWSLLGSTWETTGHVHPEYAGRRSSEAVVQASEERFSSQKLIPKLIHACCCVLPPLALREPPQYFPPNNWVIWGGHRGSHTSHAGRRRSAHSVQTAEGHLFAEKTDTPLRALTRRGRQRFLCPQESAVRHR